MAALMTVWDAEDEFSDSLQLDVQPGVGPHGAAVVSLWAGDEYDPAYLTPAAARKAAVELPAILLRLAEAADPGRGAPAWCWRWRTALTLIFSEGRRPVTTRLEGMAARPVDSRRLRAWLVREWRELAHLPAGLRSKGKA